MQAIEGVTEHQDLYLKSGNVEYTVCIRLVMIFDAG